MAGAVVVRGLRELNRDFARMGPDLRRELRAEWKRVTEPVAQAAQAKAARFGAKTAGGIVPRVRTNGAAVQQRLGKTTGQHPFFGVLQMRTVLEPALDENQERVIDEIEHVLDRLGGEHGF